MINGELKRAEVTQQDYINAGSIGQTHLYWSDLTTPGLYRRESWERQDYEKLLAVLMCRERQLEIAVSLLSEKNRKKVGA